MDQDTQTIDITPTWQGLLPLLVEVAANGDSAAGRKSAMDELMRLAKTVDESNTANKLPSLDAARAEHAELLELLSQATYYMTLDKGSAYISVEYMQKQDTLRDQIKSVLSRTALTASK